ncbi:DNA-binding response regulator [Leptospira yasudae]|uniref:LytR/AlgR family response regulator transcription factor n=1 Tax=Leptospira yasudae TaxID=2202201 RepID=UPI000E59F2D8|nr:LytTR family DNA-binding domain-containing protein [Leptospira yasudae]MBW0432047.1 response regulator transcription factor [Leptospira yasudae]RHX95474.1 DNA-binding response regulator [Leptospira yasudae]TGK27009.1 DNA-binding response regulator [Leptospira yasudae]TGM08197.1 DNA-binding response regulator [Leptospira yasudae]TGN02405.1 DNA-binding response regulator [Leptospira yasudae]
MKDLLYSVLIVEDEAPARELLRKYLEEWTSFKIDAVAGNGRQALEVLERKNFDLVFLDVNLPEKSGIQVLEEKGKPAPALVFTTAYRDHALRAFEAGALDYLLKPYSRERFRETMTRVEEFLSVRKKGNKAEAYLFFRESGILHRLSLSKLLYLTANGKKCVLHSTEKDHETPKLLGDLEEELPGDRFVRIHKKYILNLEYISGMKSNAGGGYEVFLNDEDETVLPVGREYVSVLKEKFRENVN